MLAMPALAQAPNEGLTKVKERELEEVRAQISQLKQSMDRRAAERDEITASLQTAELQIAEKRINLSELERQRKGVTEPNLTELDHPKKERCARSRGAGAGSAPRRPPARASAKGRKQPESRARSGEMMNWMALSVCSRAAHGVSAAWSTGRSGFWGRYGWIRPGRDRRITRRERSC